MAPSWPSRCRLPPDAALSLAARQPIAELDALAALLAPVRPCSKAAGVAAAPERWPESRRIAVADAGVHRACALGEMQRPPLTWRQGGRPRVGDWLEGA